MRSGLWQAVRPADLWVHGLDRYWRPKLADQVTEAFVISNLVPDGDDAFLDYQNHEGKAVRARFRFNQSGSLEKSNR